MAHFGPATHLLIPLLLAAGWAAHVQLLRRLLSGARRDPLSGLLTRAGWTARARRITRSRRSAVVLVDLDGFKAVNDRAGHAAGDAVITATGGRLTAWCGRGEAAGRLGGDEFVAAVVDHDGHLDDRLAELRGLLQQPVTHDGQVLRVGASIGVARLADLADPTLASALGAADRDMYRHKGRGRRGRRLITVTTSLAHLLRPLTRHHFGRAA